MHESKCLYRSLSTCRDIPPRTQISEMLVWETTSKCSSKYSGVFTACVWVSWCMLHSSRSLQLWIPLNTRGVWYWYQYNKKPHRLFSKCFPENTIISTAFFLHHVLLPVLYKRRFPDATSFTFPAMRAHLEQRTSRCETCVNSNCEKKSGSNCLHFLLKVPGVHVWK